MVAHTILRVGGRGWSLCASYDTKCSFCSGGGYAITPKVPNDLVAKIPCCGWLSFTTEPHNGEEGQEFAVAVAVAKYQKAYECSQKPIKCLWVLCDCMANKRHLMPPPPTLKKKSTQGHISCNTSPCLSFRSKGQGSERSRLYMFPLIQWGKEFQGILWSVLHAWMCYWIYDWNRNQCALASRLRWGLKTGDGDQNWREVAGGQCQQGRGSHQCQEGRLGDQCQQDRLRDHASANKTDWETMQCQQDRLRDQCQQLRQIGRPAHKKKEDGEQDLHRILITDMTVLYCAIRYESHQGSVAHLLIFKSPLVCIPSLEITLPKMQMNDTMDNNAEAMKYWALPLWGQPLICNLVDLSRMV